MHLVEKHFGENFKRHN